MAAARRERRVPPRAETRLGASAAAGHGWRVRGPWVGEARLAAGRPSFDAWVLPQGGCGLVRAWAHSGAAASGAWRASGRLGIL